LRSAALFTLALTLAGCGGGSGASIATPQTGVNAILNGATLATATSHWASTACRVQVELTSDNGFWSVVVDSSGTTTSAQETWTTAAGSDGTTVTIGPGLGLATASWVSYLTGISGSTSSQTFTANVTVRDGTSATYPLGSCTFALIQKGLS
jgi:hypothetical protein